MFMCPRFLARSNVNTILNMTASSGNIKDISTSSEFCSSLNSWALKLANDAREEQRGITMQIVVKPVLGTGSGGVTAY